MRIFFAGFRAMLPITTGVIPFGAVMGTVCSEAQLSFFQTVTMNFMVFAGASQLAAVDLMVKHAESFVVLATGLIINLRFMLYSAAISPIVQYSPYLVKLTSAYCLTDQNYAVLTAHSDKLKSNRETIIFYFGTSLCMILAWQLAVMGGYIFGNFAPSTWALEYAVPLSFVALTIPTIRNRKYFAVVLFSSLLSLTLSVMPYNLGLITTALTSIALGAFLTRQRTAA